MTTLTKFMIIAGADNRPPMLDKTMYDSWKSRMELYIENSENGRMILKLVENGPLIWPTVEENCETKRKKDDLIACLNKAMAFMSVVASSCFPSTNNQLRASSNLRNHTTIQDDRVTVQQVQGRQVQSYAGVGKKGNATSLEANNAGVQAKEKAMVAKAQESGLVLDEEQLGFLADLRISDCHDV
nr:integrase, catalytic region, zinc finger, CCHC-type, peptidase aspartic, catalytic [Tanacetum cinerariifolium]